MALKYPEPLPVMPLCEVHGYSPCTPCRVCGECIAHLDTCTENCDFDEDAW